MPSPLKILLILAFWLASTAWVLWAKVIRWQVVEGPPVVAIDIADEVRSQPSHWTVWRIGAKGKPDQKLGDMTTQMKYNPGDDTFLNVTKIPELKIAIGPLAVKASKVDLQMTLDRHGRLVSQYMSATCEALDFSGNPLGSGTATVRAKVEGGQLRGQCQIESPISLLNIKKELPPVPVAEGQVLNPLMPLNRIQGIQPGKRWVIHYSDPLRDSIGILFNFPQKPAELLATVRTEPSVYERKNEPPLTCWVIDYESQDKTIRAETWVERETGRVMRQQVTMDEEQLRFDRRD